jgi:AGCS family alanine or glycine:cation symporter
VVALLTALVVFGGIRRIASVTQTLVPLMALAYLLLGLAVVAIHIDQLPVVFAEIFVSTLGEWSNIALSIIIFLLAFSSILGNYYYGQSNIEFITTRRGVLPAYRVAVVLAVLVGSLASADLVWSFADGIMGVMALVNLVAIALLSGIAFRLLRDYTRQRREGRDPVFTRDLLPGVTGVECWEDELTVTGPLDLITKKRQSQKHRDHLHGAQQ